MTPTPEPRPNWIFASITVLWALAVGFGVRLLLAVVAQGVGGPKTIQWLETSPFGLSILAATIQLALFGLVVWRANAVSNIRDDVLRALRERKTRGLWSAGFILGVGPLANLSAMAVAKLTHADLSSMKRVGDLIRQASLFEILVLGIVITILPAIVEESLFRGLVFQSIRGKKVWLALVLQAVAFGVFHLDVAQGVATAILGLGFGYVVLSTGSLASSIVAHAAYNLMVLLSQRFLPTEDGPLAAQLLELFVGLLVASVAARALHLGRVRA